MICKTKKKNKCKRNYKTIRTLKKTRKILMNKKTIKRNYKKNYKRNYKSNYGKANNTMKGGAFGHIGNIGNYLVTKISNAGRAVSESIQTISGKFTNPNPLQTTQPMMVSEPSSKSASASVSASVNTKGFEKFTSCRGEKTSLANYLDKNYHVNASNETKAHKKHIIDTFSEPYWQIINPKGDGLCMLHAIFESLQLDNVDYISILVAGFQKYLEMDEEKYIYIQKSDGDLIIINSEDTLDILTANIINILDDNNLSSQLFPIIILGLKIMFNLNVDILLLTRDARSKNPYVKIIYLSTQDSDINKKGIILLNDGGHYKSLIADQAAIYKKIESIEKGNIW